MKRVVTLALVLASSVVGLVAQQPAEWVRFQSPEGRYAVLLPRQPTLTTQETTAATGEKLTQYLAQLEDGQAVYLVAYFDMAPDMTLTLEKARDGVLRAMKCTLAQESRITAAGSPALDFSAACVLDGVDYIVRARVVAVGNRVYTPEIVYPKREADARATAIVRFLDTFQVTATGQ
jgi:hypothetical protein